MDETRVSPAIVAVVCGECHETRDADRVPDFCGTCGAIAPRWAVVSSEAVGALDHRLLVELVGEWPAWAVDQARADFGDHLRLPRGP